MTEHVSLKVRPLHKEYLVLRSKSERDALTVNRNIWRPSGTSGRLSGLDITPRRPTGRVSLASGPPPESPLSAPEFRQWRGARRSQLGRDWWEKFCIPGKESSWWWKDKPYKRWRSRPNKDLSFISQSDKL